MTYLLAMNRKKHIIYLGCSGFPYGLAEIQKIILISKGLVRSGNDVTVIAKRGIHRKLEQPDIQVTGKFEGIDYHYTSGYPFYHENFFIRNFYKLKGYFSETFYVGKLNRRKKIDCAIISTHNFYAVLYYVILSRIYGFKTILNYVEFYSGIKKKPFQFKMTLNDYLFDKYCPRIVDAVFPISEFLIEQIKKVAPKQKYLKLFLTDFEKFKDSKVQPGEEYFLFCGAANYKEIVKFTIESFENLKNTSTLLYLVINGSDADIAEIKKYIAESGENDRIRFFTRLAEKDLFNKYKNAKALLIPLRPTLQDIARFPHKISEYLASGNPVVSTNYGEVKYYFTDMENMLIADSYEVDQFSAKMQFVLDHEDEARKIGINGMNMALDQFDYAQVGRKIDAFLDELK